jgi:hypothetical protein
MGKAHRAYVEAEKARIAELIESQDSDLVLQGIDEMRYPLRGIWRPMLNRLVIEHPSSRVKAAAKARCVHLFPASKKAGASQAPPREATMTHTSSEPQQRVHHYRDDQPRG